VAVNTGRSAKKTDQGRSVHPGLVAVSVVVLLIVVGWLAYANLLAPPKPAPMDAKGQANHDYIKRLAKQSGGDMSKLSPDDAQKLQEMTKGYGAMALKAALKEQ
jgi:hypothetical protein